jgi:hypothetical protein
MNIYGYSIKELWDTIKRLHLMIYRVEEWGEIQIKDIINSFTEIIEIILNICNNIEPMYKRHLELQIDMSRKEQSHIIS